jgi:type II secretory pathway pseudopilin PulG
VSARLRNEDGFTLVELLAATAVGMIVILAAFALLDNAVRLSTQTTQRVDALQRGRLAMDLMAQQLRSQVCLDASNPALAVAQADRVEFYADLSDGSRLPEKRVLRYDAAGRTIRQDVSPATSNSPWTFAATPTTRTLLTDVTDLSPTPVFRYFAAGDVELTALPLSKPDRERVVKVSLNYVVRPAGGTNGNVKNRAVFLDDVYVRTTDPNKPTPTPTCE